MSLSEEELEEDLAKKHKKKSLAQKRKKAKRLARKEERLSKKGKVGPAEEEEHLSKEEEELPHGGEGEFPSGKEEESLSEEEEESLSEEEEESLSEKEQESLSEEEEESLSEEEKSLSDEEEESLREEEEESLREEEEESLREEESLSEEEEERLSEEEEESLSEEEERLSEEEEEESLRKEKEEREKMQKKEEERQKDMGILSKEKEKEHRAREVMRSEERALKIEISKRKVGLPKPTTEGEDLAEKREGTTIRKMIFKKKSLLDGKREFRLRDKSSLKIPVQVTLVKKERMPLKVLKGHVDLEEKQDSQIFEEHPMTCSLRRQEAVLLEKARSVFLQTIETGLETQISEGLHKPQFQLSDTIMKPHKTERRPKGDRWKWFIRYHDLPAEKTEGQAPAPAPAPTPIPTLASSPEKPAYSKASMSDEDWIKNALTRLQAGQQLSRDSFHRLSQLLRDSPSKGYLKWMHLSNLKTIAKHFGKNLELSHPDKLQPYKDILRPMHLKVIPPIRRKEKESMLESFSIPKPVFLSATKRTQTQPILNWHLTAESYREKQARQLSMAVREIKHVYPVRRYVPTTLYPLMDKNSLALKSQKDFPALRGRGELLKFSKAKEEALPVPAPVLPSITKIIQVPEAINWHILGEPYRSGRIEQLSNVLKEMEAQHFYPATRDIFTGAHAPVHKQTLALMFQKDLWNFKGRGRPPKLRKLEKKTQLISNKKEELPSWETFVALYYVLRILQQRYAKDTAAWMEQFYQLMDLYQLKSPQIQRLLQDLLLRDEPQSQEITYREALNTMELVPGERLFYHLFCGRSHIPKNPPEFQDVIPLPGQNKVHSIQPVGIAQYGFLELAWKSLPQVNPYCTDRPPNIPTPTF